MESDNLQLTVMEQDCLEYTTGFVAKRFIIKYPQLGTVTNQLTNNNTSWTKHLSKGHLISPSKELLSCAEIFEKIFRDFHGLNIRKEPQIFKSLHEILLCNDDIKKLGIPNEVLECMIRTRTYIRINYLNKVLLEKALNDKTKKLKKF